MSREHDLGQIKWIAVHSISANDTTKLPKTTPSKPSRAVGKARTIPGRLRTNTPCPLPAARQTIASPRLAETAKNYARAARASNTQRAYAADWRHFSSWLRRQGLSQLPPDPQTVGLYLAACADGSGHGAKPTSVATLERAPLRDLLALPPAWRAARSRDRHISSVLAGIRRQHGKPPVQKEAVFADELLAMLATLDMDLRGLRDRAILAIGFAGGLRRSEITGLDCGSEQSEDGTGWVEIFGGWSHLPTINGKTGWREVEIGRGSRPETCPVALLETWMRLATRRARPTVSPDRAQKRRRLLRAPHRQARRQARQTRAQGGRARRSPRGRTQARLRRPFVSRRPRLLGGRSTKRECKSSSATPAPK